MQMAVAKAQMAAQKIAATLKPSSKRSQMQRAVVAPVITARTIHMTFEFWCSRSLKYSRKVFLV